MARISLDDRIFIDARFRRLSIIVGGEGNALLLLVTFWAAAQKHWGNEKSLMSEEDFVAFGFGPILECKLAERRPGGVYAKGTEEHLNWYLQKCRAGKSRASAQRNHDGTFSPAGHQRVTSGEPASAPAAHQPPTPTPALSPTPTPEIQNQNPNTKEGYGIQRARARMIEDSPPTKLSPAILIGMEKELERKATKMFNDWFCAVRTEGGMLEANAFPKLSAESLSAFKGLHPSWPQFWNDYVFHNKKGTEDFYRKSAIADIKAFLCYGSSTNHKILLEREHNETH